MLSALRLALAASALLWVAGIAALIFTPALAPAAPGVLTASVLLAIGAVLVLLRRLNTRVLSLEQRVSKLRSTAPRPQPALPSSEDDWAPRPTADARTVAGILAVAARIDVGPLLRLGTADHSALADTIAIVERTAPGRVVVVGAPAEGFALAAVSARGDRRAVTVIVARESEAEALRAETADESDSVLEIVHLPGDAGGADGGWSPGALATVPFDGLVYLGGPPWSVGPAVRDSLVDRVLAGRATVTGVVVPEPRRLESQAILGRLQAGGFRVTRETLSTAYLEPSASPRG